ncbi:nucleoside diphosphate kinase regulator [Pannonibacter sp. SL95]|jgi:regulator of nucleoside diphosphate kinase|uniref:nucleoside diphosphate kinase regulator n=1 Tax=Pannonibacter sp. SL95 TaxID=2995153 RepID=UPI00227423D7|nr:nucleoside diphosphate kinase regulator [Pannonibacter sp. SL95]MCY1709007.1 nucleoside diphosphate kinase regulator [Pannonibacter sp. SL95]
MSNPSIKAPALPRLVLGIEDYGKLMAIASSVTGPTADVADQLIIELDRARIVAQAKLPEDAVRMGSIVTFTTNDAQQRQLQLVYPGEADINAGKVSVLTPIGAALIGLRQGQTIPWSSRDGRDLVLTVVEVRQEA